MTRTLLTGATGLVGRRLVENVPGAVVLTRSTSRALSRLGPVQAHAWQPGDGPPPMAALEDVEVVFNLAGEPVSEGRWSTRKKRAIRDSRIASTRNLVDGIARMERKPRVLVSASAVGFYGDRGEEQLDEDSGQGSGFLADVCADWEQEAMAAADLGVRVVCVRIGIVLATGGGALAKMLTPFRLGAGGRLGSGKQWMPWIHLDDLVALLLHAANDEQMRGAVNAVAPNPVSNASFTRVLGRILNRPTFISAPRAALRLAFGEMSEIMLASQRVAPRIALESGFEFRHTRLSGALESLLSPEAARAA